MRAQVAKLKMNVTYTSMQATRTRSLMGLQKPLLTMFMAKGFDGTSPSYIKTQRNRFFTALSHASWQKMMKSGNRRVSKLLDTAIPQG